MLFTWYRMRQRAPLPPDERPDFVQAGHTRTSYMLAALDPRAPDFPPEPEPDADAPAGG
jgi:hypothetical protein